MAELDHVALGVADLDERIDALAAIGFELRRRGTVISTGERMAMVNQPGEGVKLELIENPDRLGFLQLAVRVDDVRAEFDRLAAGGYRPVREPFRIEPARAESALLEDPAGWQIQLIRYDPDSPDL